MAIDACRSAVRMGAEKVYVVYRRSQAEMPADHSEVQEAMEEGVEFIYQTGPVAIKGEQGRASGLECVRMELGDPDETGRRRPKPVPGSNCVLDADLVIIAAGTMTDPLIAETAGLKSNAQGGIWVSEDGATSRLGVFAGGDAVTGPASVIEAMRAGRTAAKSIDEYIKGRQ